MTSDLYPLKFQPIYKERIWGGHKLKTILDKDIPDGSIGESWELSDVDADTSIISHGHLKGVSLKELQAAYTYDLVGHKNHKIFRDKFPLLIKFIDAKEDLSIQLHPNDALAKERHDSFGKTEMWYVLQSDQGSELIIDFNQEMNKELYLKHLKEKTLPSIMNVEKVNKGDSYFIDVGRVHAIGGGVMVAEIQQTSDITYRLHDWDRVDEHGNSRELHTDLAMDAIDFEMPKDFEVTYTKEVNQSNLMVQCPYFTTNFLPVEGKVELQNTHDSFIIYMCVEGDGQIDSNGKVVEIKKGETLLMPAALKNYSIFAENAQFLEVYV